MTKVVLHLALLLAALVCCYALVGAWRSRPRSWASRLDERRRRRAEAGEAARSIVTFRREQARDRGL